MCKFVFECGCVREVKNDGDIIFPCEKHKDKPNYSCNMCCAKVMGELDDAIRKIPKLAKQMDNSFLYPNES